MKHLMMAVFRNGWVGIVLALVMAACAPAPAQDAPLAASQVQAVSIENSTEKSTENVWGKVPYCNCFGDAMTKNVARELAEANLAVKLQEQSPREGWLYFVVSFDPTAATRAQIGDAIAAGGGEMLDGPP